MDWKNLKDSEDDSNSDKVTSELYENLNIANFKLAFENIVELLDSNKKSGDFKNLFSFVFSNYCEELVQNSDYEVLYKCFETALKHFPEDSDILNDLGVIYQR